MVFGKYYCRITSWYEEFWADIMLMDYMRKNAHILLIINEKIKSAT